MNHHWDEFSKSLAEESVPRRESLRRLGAVFAGVVLAPLGIGTAWAVAQDPCKTFCRCSNKKQQNACLAACRACNQATSRLCGSCGNYVCRNIANDANNCGACGNVCDDVLPNEYGACISGVCYYDCVEGAVDCNGICTDVSGDPANCGACGNVCPASAPYCNQGECNNCGAGWCGGHCIDVLFDALNCGACGHACQPTEYCSFGSCEGYYYE